MKFIVLWSDLLIFLLVCSLSLFFYKLRQDPQTRERWAQVFSARIGMVTFTIIIGYVAVALLDSIHFRKALDAPEGMVTDEIFYDNKVTSVLDVMMLGMGDRFERTYSSPFALKSFEKKDMKDAQGRDIRDYPDLKHAGQHLDSAAEKGMDILLKSVLGILYGLLIGALFILIQWLFLRRSVYPWTASWITQLVVITGLSWAVYISRYYHVLGTDLGGTDVLFQSVKGIRTGVLLGTPGYLDHATYRHHLGSFGRVL